jgi:hypothetical protein
VGELAAHDPRQPEVTLAAVGRLPPSEGDLRGDALPPPSGRDAEIVVVRSDGLSQVRGVRGLRRGGRADELLERADEVDPSCVIQRRATPAPRAASPRSRLR